MVAGCPVPSAHRRLRDVHQYWHSLAESYMDPDSFRRTLNTTIQELRNVSFLVQKEKSSLPNFDVWYLPWQEEARADNVMRWVVDSRNRIVKQGDLDLLSKMTARYHIDWVRSTQAELDLPPGMPLLVAARTFHSRLGSPPVGLITVRRRWTDYRLPGRELLDALRGPYEKCADLLLKAHQASDVNDCPISLATPECSDDSPTPECMANPAQYTEVSVDVSEGTLAILRSRPVERDAEGMREASERYGGAERFADALSDAKDALDAVDIYIEMGKRILAVDEDLVLMCVFFRGPAVVAQMGGKPENHYSKVLLADRIAETALNTGADSVLLSADSWHAKFTGTDLDILPVAERPDRESMLTVTAVAKDGRALSKGLPYSRQPGGSAVFDEIEVTFFASDNILGSLKNAWKIDRWNNAAQPENEP